MQGVFEGLGGEAVGRDGERHGGGLHRNADIVKVIALKQLRVTLCALDESFGAGVAVLFEQTLFKAAGVHADADGDIVPAAGLGDGPDVLRRADVAGVDAYLIDTALGGFEGEAVIKMDIRDERDAHLLLYRGDGSGRLHIRQRDAHDVRARGLHGLYLRDRRVNVPGLGIAHGLHGDGRAAAYLDAPGLYLLHCVSFIHYFVTILIISLNIMTAISPSRSTMPAAWI